MEARYKKMGLKMQFTASYCQVQEQKIADYLLNMVGEESFLPGLDRIRPLFESYSQTYYDQGTKIVTVGGTNGKGETCFSLAKLLESDSLSVGVWSSPHILSVRERFSFNGKLVTYPMLRQSVEQVLNRCRNLEIEVSYYELLFATFCQLALHYKPNYLILEVGLGGRFDAVNLFCPNYTGITSISRDHQGVLGHRLREILSEKLGITRPKVPLVSFIESGYLRERVAKSASQLGHPLIDLEKLFSGVKDYCHRNQIVAASLYLLIREQAVTASNITQLLEKTKFPTLKGRREVVTYNKRNYIFIGAHNVDGIRKLVQSEIELKEVLLSFSKRSLEDMKCGVKILQNVGAEVFLTAFDHPKAASQSDLTQLNAAHFVNDWCQFIANRNDTEGTTIIAGSYYFIGEVQKYMSENFD
ncbi:MAG: hypothetical protein KAG61_11110 [Bacteriovoracaceae bacterium]|nr:hypothetical protein [Bacteriovoracaceae bacterium]